MRAHPAIMLETRVAALERWGRKIVGLSLPF